MMSRKTVPVRNTSHHGSWGSRSGPSGSTAGVRLVLLSRLVTVYSPVDAKGRFCMRACGGKLPTLPSPGRPKHSVSQITIGSLFSAS